MLHDEEIEGLNIPTGIPLVYELSCDLIPIRKYYPGDTQQINRGQITKTAEGVANQGRIVV